MRIAFPNKLDFTIKQFTLDGTLLAKMKMKNEKATGVFIMFNEKEDNIYYKIRLEGRVERTIRGLSYDELIAKLKELEEAKE